MKSMLCGIGKSAGLSISSTTPLVRCTRYSTLGAVAMSDRLNSRSKRSFTISMCRRPRNPQRKPKPSAPDDSGAYVMDASLSFSFSRLSRINSKSSPSIGKSPQNTIGFGSL